MSDNKKYYYLKLKENFYDRPEIKAIESMENGYEYITIIQKMYLRSLERGGKLMITDTIPYDLIMLAKVLGHKQETIVAAIAVFQKFHLIKIMDDRSIYMTEIQNYIGRSSTEADRKRDYRKMIEDKGQMSIKCPDISPPEKEIEIEKEIEKEIWTKIENEINEIHKLSFKKIDKDIINKDIRELTIYFYNQIMTYIKPPTYIKNPPDLRPWARDIDKLHRLDGIPIENIKLVMDWVIKDKFWSNNILSGKKLRSQFNKLYLQATRIEKENTSNNKKPDLFRARNACIESIPKEMLDQLGLSNNIKQIGEKK